ncbi:MAG: hypothetical protein OEY34_08205 [Cyclobacteriaceae bacterium]|nr:hypothetical protein [Cyclobacteriaceae bacterium]
MIGIEDFKILSFDKKCELVTVCGDFLAHLNFGSVKYYLYNLENFYVEIAYSTERKKITQVIPIQNINQLDRYLDEIDISEALLSIDN